MYKYARGEKYALLAVVMSWPIFAIVVIVRNLASYDSEWCFVL